MWLQNDPQKAPKIEPETNQNRRQKRRLKKQLLKSVLKLSWGDLGPILGRLETRLGVKIVLPCIVALVFLKNRLLEKMKLQEATWAHLGPKWSQLGCPRGSKMEPKSGPRGSKKGEEK